VVSITNTGTTGFVTSTNFTGGPPNDFRIGGLHTTTQVGSMAFDFNVLPSISLGPGGISFALAPDMTAAPTPFAGITPPTPGVVQPGGGVPLPLAAPVSPLAPSPLAVSGSAPAALVDDTETPKSDTSRVSAPKPTVVIPGVNGAPLAKPPTGTSGVTGGNPFNPLAPFTPITDAITNGIGAITGARPGAASGTDSSGAPSGAGTGGPSGGADSGGNGSGEG
jgi:hypothetical protein